MTGAVHVGVLLLPRSILTIREGMIAEVVSLAWDIRMYRDDARAVLAVIVMNPDNREIGYCWATIIHRDYAR